MYFYVKMMSCFEEKDGAKRYEYIPLRCLKSYCSVLSLPFKISESVAEKSATVPAYKSPSKSEIDKIK